MKKQELLDLVESLTKPIAEEMHYEIVDIEYEKEGPDWHLTVFMDKEGGFTIDDCVAVSRALEVKLEEADPIDTPYSLQVSSPGLDRPLKKDKDFVRENGKLVDVKLFKADKERELEKDFQATLVSYDPETETVGLELSDGREIEITRKELAGIRLAVIF